MSCIFNGERIWATIGQYFPEKLKAITDYERQFNTTISRKGLTVSERAAIASPINIEDEPALMQATKREYTLPIFLPEGESWKMPAGAFGQEVSGAS